MLRCDLTRLLFVIIAIIVIQSFSMSMVRNEQFVIGDMAVQSGEIKSGYLKVPEKNGIETRIPVTVINGSKPGEVLALVAGVHGYEYPPILALYRLKEKIDPKTLSGTLILVHIANLQSFQKRIIYYNPHDWKNLNRVFPGDLEGTISQRVAYILKTEVVDRCDYLIDLHCGDGNEALIPYTYWMISGNKKMDDVSKEMALAFGIKYIIIDQSRTKDQSESKYLGNTAMLFGKPAITTESGYLGKTDEESIVRNTKGILSVMRLIGMIEGEAEMVRDPIWIDKYQVVYSDADGLFYPQTEMGYHAQKGEIMGYLTDYLGNLVQEFRAPFSGIVLYIINTPPANKGEPLFEIGSPIHSPTRPALANPPHPTLKD